MFDNAFSFIDEEFYALKVSSRQLDLLLENGWRHFGAHFFRYNLGFYENEIRLVQPLRVRLSDFTLSKSRRRILKRNQDLQIIVRPVEITAEKEMLFERHKRRFKRDAPDSIYDFLVADAANTPCEALEMCVYDKEKLLAASFFDVGESAISGIYAIFAPEEPARSLGIFTMLLEIDFAVKSGKKFYYSGYAYVGNSFYDYKKHFAALEKFDWQGNWTNFEEVD
ncbi:MAG: arginine-tRNA-protein transferase [Acidobacteriota bacterium]|nr:arginine-tRNA-protein transferase [Acidobacteriota bacterium]